MDSTLLDMGENDSTARDQVLQNMVVKPKEAAVTEPMSKIVIPEAGFCLKTRSSKGGKIFINVCKSDQVPSPKDISDKELATLLEAGDASQYRVPISLGESHIITDNAGKECQAYDIVIGSAFFETIQKRPRLKEFLLTIILEGLEDKYEILLSRDCKILKNRNFIGELPEQTIRKKSKPFIIDMDRDPNTKLISETKKELKSATPEPKYTIVREPVDGEVPEFIVLETQLPGIESQQNIRLEVGEDRLVLSTRPNLFHLDIDLPYTLDNESTGAQFNKQSKLLTVTMNVTGVGP